MYHCRAADGRPKAIIIGAGSNLGLACAVAAAPHADLILADVDSYRLDAARIALGATSRYCDVASEASVLVFANEVLSDLLPFDILINAAGDGYIRTLGMSRMFKALLPALRREGPRQVLVNIAPCGREARGCPFDHAASPEAFARLSRAFAERTRGWPVHVLTVIPESISMPDHGRLPNASLLLADLNDPARTAHEIMEQVARQTGFRLQRGRPGYPAGFGSSAASAR